MIFFERGAPRPFQKKSYIKPATPELLFMFIVLKHELDESLLWAIAVGSEKAKFRSHRGS